MGHRPIVTLTTDFGTNDHFVGAVKGVILDIVPEAAIVDVSHAVQAFDVLDGALTISQTYSYFPTGTVHLIVVDPGVGTTRRPIIASSDGYHFVAPDNGVLSMVYAREERMAVRHVTAEHYFRQPVSNTFHGRDIFAPVAAYLAKQVDSHKFGDEIQDYVRFAAPKPKPAGDNRIRAVVLKVDRFGNLITNVTPEDLPALFAGKSGFKIAVGNKEISEIRNAYAEGAPGEVFGILGSMGYLEIVANRAAAAQITGAGKGSEVSIVLGEGAAAGKGA
ncbi:MAG TPA: SAM-dependent chlorinase/fluorinase [Candidatus Sulfotelmatobacter sp.]|nr:SAM-dependent chlorinase/fluorinase [Candidatus Sulfotelmatobacter sp.]